MLLVLKHHSPRPVVGGGGLCGGGGRSCQDNWGTQCHHSGWAHLPRRHCQHLHQVTSDKKILTLASKFYLLAMRKVTAVNHTSLDINFFFFLDKEGCVREDVFPKVSMIKVLLLLPHAICSLNLFKHVLFYSKERSSSNRISHFNVT